jgi:hypothetical protein
MLKIKDIDFEKYKIEEWDSCYVSYVDQKSQEWFDLRKGRITGSVVGKILGDCKQNKYNHEELSLFIKGEKKEEFTEEEIKRMNFGNQYEDEARQKFKQIFFNKNKEVKEDKILLEDKKDINKEDKILLEEKIIGICIFKEYEFLASSPDGYFEYMKDGKKIRAGLEIKCPRFLYKCLENDYIYPNYYDQMLLCYKVLNLDEMYFFVYSYETKDYYLKKIDIYESEWNNMLKESINYYNKYLKD